MGQDPNNKTFFECEYIDNLGEIQSLRNHVYEGLNMTSKWFYSESRLLKELLDHYKLQTSFKKTHVYLVNGSNLEKDICLKLNGSKIEEDINYIFGKDLVNRMRNELSNFTNKGV